MSMIETVYVNVLRIFRFKIMHQIYLGSKAT